MCFTNKRGNAPLHKNMQVLQGYCVFMFVIHALCVKMAECSSVVNHNNNNNNTFFLSGTQGQRGERNKRHKQNTMYTDKRSKLKSLSERDPTVYVNPSTQHFPQDPKSSQSQATQICHLFCPGVFSQLDVPRKP